MRLTKFNPETGEYEYKKKAKTQEEFIAQRKAVIQRLGELEENAECRVQNAEWISTHEILPEEDKPVLVTVDGKPRDNITLSGAYFIAEYSKEEGWILEGFEHWTNGFEVTHWRKLPSPPKW